MWCVLNLAVRGLLLSIKIHAKPSFMLCSTFSALRNLILCRNVAFIETTTVQKLVDTKVWLNVRQGRAESKIFTTQAWRIICLGVRFRWSRRSRATFFPIQHRSQREIRSKCSCPFNLPYRRSINNYLDKTLSLKVHDTLVLARQSYECLMHRSRVK